MRIRILPALAFVPEEEVVLYFQALQEHFSTDDKWQKVEIVSNYFEDTYIDRPHGQSGRRHPPRFPISLWNVHKRTIEGSGRTNNCVESWHRTF